VTAELWLLVAAAALLLVLPIVYGVGMIRQVGRDAMLGNREDFPTVTGWPARGQRAHRNLIENLLPFAIVVLAADAAAVHSAWTVAGCAVFLAARLAHAAAYLAGNGPVRAMAFYAGTLGTLTVAAALI